VAVPRSLLLLPARYMEANSAMPVAASSVPPIAARRRAWQLWDDQYLAYADETGVTDVVCVHQCFHGSAKLARNLGQGVA